ncbi:MAG TPA: MBL fold metallo-hydrolase, partial [Abditibacterium sp.]
MKLRFLGTGTSYGVPYIGCQCEVCTSNDPRDKRLRASILVEDEADDADLLRLIVDTGPDFRAQCLRAGVDQLSAVLWTHLHNDHIIGLDDIRPFTDRQGYIDGYTDASTMARMRQIFDYVFQEGRNHGGFPRVTPHVIEPFQTLRFGALEVTPLPIFHGPRPIFAYEFQKAGRRLVYATDCSAIPNESMQRMKNCEVFVVDALRPIAHPNHFSVAQALDAIEKIRPNRAFFTHITHELGHAATEATLPPHVKMA